MRLDEHANYAEQRVQSLHSAELVVPLLQEHVDIRSVVDVGCGVGAWLSAFKRFGADEILGLDGPWVNSEDLLVPETCFRVVDLREPLEIDRTFDLVVSLEVGEHLPAESAPTFVRSLTKLGPVVLFSAAIPQQGGCGHVNEQWPDYWQALFREQGYVVVDCIRPQIWSNPDVCWWYAQNTLLYVREDALAANEALQRARDRTVEAQLPLVHPRKYMTTRTPLWRSLKSRSRDRIAGLWGSLRSRWP